MKIVKDLEQELVQAPKSADRPLLSLAFLRQAAECVMLLNCEGRVSFISDGGREALGIGALRDLVGRPWWEFWPGPAEEEMRAAIGSAFSGRTGVLTLARDGDRRLWQITVTPLVNGAGEVESVLVAHKDGGAAAIAG